MIEKFIVPLMMAFGAYLYVTRDEGFRFDKATQEHREAFVERQATRWAVQSGLTGFGVAQLDGLRISGDARSANLRITLAMGAATKINPQLMHGLACEAYNNSRMPDFGIRAVATVRKADGSLAYTVSVSPGLCKSNRPAA